MVVYLPRILRDKAEIANVMGVCEAAVDVWIHEGAPIAVEEDGNRKLYSAEAAELQRWRLEHMREGEEA